MSQQNQPLNLPPGKPGKSFLTIVNARTVRLSGDIKQFKPIYNESDDIIKLEGVELDYYIGQVIRPKLKTPYKINVIQKLTAGGDPKNPAQGYDLSIARTNLSSIFAAPLLGGNRELFLWDKYFVNAFVETQDDKNIIAMLYRFSGDVLFLKFEAALCAFRTFKYKIDTDSSHVLFVFEVPDTSQSAYEHLMNSEYSKIDDFLKLKILDYHGFNMDGQTARVLFKSQILKAELEEKLDCIIPAENELHSALDMSQERFDPEYYYTPKSIVERKSNVKST
jgi:hypothetical protein